MPHFHLSVSLNAILWTLIVLMGSSIASEPHSLQEVVQFRELELDEPATSFAMTEDGRQLVLTHQVAHFVSIYDVMSKQVTATIPCQSPRSVICRGEEAYVVNFGESTISILSRANGWKKINDVKLPKPYIDHIAAAQGKQFNRELIASCRSGVAGENLVYSVDIDQDTAKELCKTSLAEVSADGRLIMLQALLHDDGYGGLAAHNYKELTDANGSRDPLFRGGTGQTPYVFQTFPGSYWVGQSSIFGGVPITSLHSEPDSLIIPDRAQKQFYVITSESIKCVQFNTSFREVGMRRAQYPRNFKDFSMIFQYMDRSRSRMCDQPCAYVHGDQLHLFVITPKGAAVLAAETTAFK